MNTTNIKSCVADPDSDPDPHVLSLPDPDPYIIMPK
jgi:hypothetical protein